MLQLIPGADEASTKEEAFQIDRMKAAWRPSPAHLRVRSFPTPYAQAEMMAYVLGLLELIPGAKQVSPEAENPRLQQSFERWRLLLLGVVLGELEIETVDLRTPAARHFGAMLARLRPECPFIGLIRAADKAGVGGRKLVVGATDPQCLLWCSPRAGGYWNELKSRIDASSSRQAAMALLADWREVLRDNGQWNPSGDRSPPWMKALEVLLAGTEHTGGRALAEDSRFVGPVQLAVPARAGGAAEDVIAYLPVLHPGWASRFLELLFYQPVPRGRDAGTVVLVDPVGRETAEISMAPRHAAPGLELLAGVGQIRENPNAARMHGSAYWLEDRASAPGYRRLVFAPLLDAAARSHRRVKLDERDVRAFPILFPDAVRLLVAQPAADTADGARIQLSRAVTTRLRAGDRAPQTGRLLSTWNLAAPLPRIVAVPAGAAGVNVGLVESFGSADRPVDVGEIRALGFALWLAYVGEADLRADGAAVVWTAAEEQELFGRSVVGEIECPIEVHRDALACVHADAERQRARDRLATLQRFRRTWAAVGEGDGDRPEVQAARLGRLAAETFVEWVLAGRDKLGDFGPRVQQPSRSYAITERARLPIFVDPYARWDG